MSKVKKMLKTVTKLLGLAPPKAPPLPKPVVPAAPAPTRREDTGAIVQIGSGAGDQRVSGGGTASIGRKVDILGGLGLGGLNI